MRKFSFILSIISLGGSEAVSGDIVREGDAPIGRDGEGPSSR